MPNVVCAACGSPAQVPAQDHYFWCRECGARQDLLRSASQSSEEKRPAPPSPPDRTAAHVTVRVETPLTGNSNAEEAGARLSGACPWCGTFVELGALCEACGSPTPELDGLGRVPDVPAAPSHETDPAPVDVTEAVEHPPLT